MASIFFDIDGTLIDRYGVVEQSTIRAVDRLKDNGH
ncbi:MAG: HAD hydrolase family protein, partial [Eubacterium sp.]|nr:HAD hydrolase family protein [Eubacterium sp.]